MGHWQRQSAIKALPVGENRPRVAYMACNRRFSRQVYRLCANAEALR